MKILLTGSKGFIGTALKAELIKNGYEVKDYDLPNGDILDELTLEIAIQYCDLIIHSAAMADITICHKKQDDTFCVNIRGTYNVAKLCAKHKKKMVFISTCCVYGNSFDDIEREYVTALNAREPYAVSKVAGEFIIRGMPNLEFEILRIGTVYGVGMREALFTYICLDYILRDITILIDGDGKQVRQLIYIEDLIHGIVAAVDRFKAGSIYNLCGTQKVSAIQTMETAEDIIGKRAKYEYREQRYGQTFNENISIEKARAELCWIPGTNFYDGMKYTFDNDKRFK